MSSLAADKALGIVDGVGWVECGLVLGGLTDQTVAIREGDDGRGDTVTLVVGDDLHTAVDIDADTLRAGRVCRELEDSSCAEASSRKIDS